MAEKVYSTSKLINLHSADGSTLLIPKVPLSTVDNNAYTVVDGAIVTKGAGVSLQAAVQAEIAAAIADDVVGNYVPWTDGSNVEIPGTLDVTGAATLKGAVRVEGKLVAAQDMYIETTSNGETTSTKVATMADIDGITGGTLNNYYTKDEVDTIAEGVLEDANSYTDAQIADALTGLPDGSSLIPYIDAQDDAHQAAAEATAKAYTDKQDSTLREELLGAIGSSIDAIDHLKREIVQDELPAVEDADLTTIYMVPSVIGEGEAARTVYVEYMVINGKWETIGDSDVQLVNYYTKAETDAAIEAAFNDFDGGFGDSGLKDYIDSQDDAHQAAAEAAASAYTDAEVAKASAYTDAEVAKASSYTDAQIASALTGLPEGSKLVAYIDAQDDAHLGSANTYTDAASSTLNAAIVAVDNKFANYYDKDGIAGLGYATITQVNTASAAAVAEANGYTDDALANYFDKDAITTSYVPFAEDGSSVILTGDITAATANLQGANIDGDAGVGGLLTATTVSVVTDADVAGNLTVAGEASVNLLAAADALFVSSNVSVVVPLDVDSKATFGADIQVADSAVIMGNLDVQSGQAKFGNSVWVESGTTLYAESIVATHIDVTTETAFQKLAIKQQSTESAVVFLTPSAVEAPEAYFQNMTVSSTATVSTLSANNADIGEYAAVGVAVVDIPTDQTGSIASHGLYAADAWVKREGSFVQVATIDDITAAFDGFGDSGLKAYIDAQDDAHQSAAEATAKAYTDAEIAKLDSTYATDAELAAASSSIMNTINALPGVGEGAILYDIIEDEQI